MRQEEGKLCLLLVDRFWERGRGEGGEVREGMDEVEKGGGGAEGCEAPEKDGRGACCGGVEGIGECGGYGKGVFVVGGLDRLGGRLFLDSQT